MKDPERTVISQYFDSPTIRAIVEAMNQWKDPGPDIQLLYTDVLDLDTAQGYGLDRWGRIVGVNRVLNAANGMHFGFAEAQDAAESGFDWGDCFFSGGPTTAPTLMDDALFRTLILAKAASNITDGSGQSYNAILMMLFGDLGSCWIRDGLDMTMQYVFSFYLPPLQSAIFFQSGVIPRPTGVSATVIEGVTPS
jgi:hypothetical protein